MVVVCGVVVAVVAYVISKVATVLFSLPIVQDILLGDVFVSVILLIILAVVIWVIAKGH